MSHITASLVLMKNKKPDLSHRYPIYIRLTLNRSLSYINTHHKALLIDWNVPGKCLKNRVTNSIRINSDLRRALTRVQDMIIDHRLDDTTLSLERLKSLLNLSIKDSTDFVSFAEDTTLKLKNKFSSESLKQMKYEVKKLQAFKPTIKMCDITVHFLQDYEHWMRTVRIPNNCTNTVWKSMKFVKRTVNAAIDQNIFKKDNYPFGRNKYNCKSEESLREYLTMDEVSILVDNIPSMTSGLAKLAWSFVVCCYCGLRYGDISKFDFDRSIVEDRLILYTSKNKKTVSIKIHNRMADALEHFKDTGDVVQNQVANRYLKKIGLICGFNKVLTFHMARHTFAVECANLGIPIEVVKRLLGHSNIKTTAIYYKIIDTAVDKEMDKWN